MRTITYTFTTQTFKEKQKVNTMKKLFRINITQNTPDETDLHTFLEEKIKDTLRFDLVSTLEVDEFITHTFSNDSVVLKTNNFIKKLSDSLLASGSSFDGEELLFMIDQDPSDELLKEWLNPNLGNNVSESMVDNANSIYAIHAMMDGDLIPFYLLIL